MPFSITDWMIYTLWALFGFMIIDLLISFIRSFWVGSFSPTFILNYLKEILYYVLPLNIIATMVSIDPTGWILVILYFVGGIAVILKYIMDIIKKFSKKES